MRAPRAMLLLALLAPLAQAQVYQSVGPDGRPVFTDRPSPNARALDIPLPADGPAEATPQAARSKDAGFLGPYDMLEIVAPADEHRIRAVVQDAAAAVVASTPPIHVHVLPPLPEAAKP